MMATNMDVLSSIDFNQDWFRYFQPSTDQTDPKTIVANANNHQWTKTQLPHHLTEKEKEKLNSSKPFQWWYCKHFDWGASSNQQIYLIFDPSSCPKQSSNVQATIWLNGTQIFQGALVSVQDSIELSPRYLGHNENPMDKQTFANCLVICCNNTHICLDVYVFIQGKFVCATGQVKLDDSSSNSNEKQNDILDYVVSMDDSDGRISLNFNPKRKSRTRSTKSISSATLVVDEKKSRKNSGNMDDDLLVPRLAIVILIVGTRGDVQPFIALGQVLRAAGHRVRLATHETFRSFVRGNGLEFYPLAGDPADLMAFMVKNAGIIPSMSSIVEGDIKKKRRALADIIASTWLACTAPDDETNAPFTAEAIIANPPSFGHIHCAEKLQIPLHIMFTMPWTPTTAFPHPLSNIDSSVGPTEKINFYSYDVIEMLTWTGMRDIINDFREKTLHLSALNNRQAIHALIDDRVPHTYCWSPSLVAKPHDWDTHISVSGFFFLDLGTAYDNPPRDLLEFLGLNEQGNKYEKALPAPIYIGFGSITGHDSRRILAVVLNALNQTGYRALLSGLASESDQLPPNVFRIGNVPHDWLFQYVSAVCHHGGAGTTAAGLRAGKPTIVVPFFGDQFFWGSVIEKSGAGSRPIPGKSITAEKLANAFHFVHKSSTKEAAERLRTAISQENGCLEAVRAFHANLPLKRLHSDLEPTFAACFYLKKYNLQISRPVAQVLVGADVLDESELQIHTTREWQFMHDDRMHFFASGIIEHSQKAFSSMFTDTADDLKRAARNKDPTTRTLEGAGYIAKGVGLGIGHLSIGCLSLYGEMTDALDLVTTLYDPYSNSKARPRPRVVDFKSGAKAAGAALWNGWKDGITGIVTQPRTGYERHGVLGGAAGTLIGIVNIGMKPSVGTMSSITWLGRGTYASVKKAIETYGKEGRRISPGLFDSASNASDGSNQDYDDDKSIPTAIKKAAALSGLHPRVCQHIVDEFEKIKAEQEEKVSSLSSSKKSLILDFFTKSK